MACPVPAAAQSIHGERRLGPETVENRVRPGQEGTGITTGSLRFLPSVAFGTIATDDLYARRSPRVADIGGSLAPALAVEQRGQSHLLALRLDALFERYASHPREGTDRYGATLQTAADLSAHLRVSLDAGIARRIETRGTTGDTLFGVAPIAYRQITLAAHAEADHGPTRLAFDLDFDRYDYADRHDGQTVIPLRQRAYATARAGVRVTQALSPAVGTFVALQVNTSRYPHENSGTPARASHGFVALAGLAFGHERLVEGTISAGYLRQVFASPRYPVIAGFAYSANLRWHVTPLTSLGFDAGKTIQRSPIIDVAGVEQQRFTMGAAHELLRTLILRPAVSYAIDTYRGGNRVDRFASGELTATWQAAPHVTLDATLRHALARTNAAAAKPREFDQNRATLTLKYVF